MIQMQETELQDILKSNGWAMIRRKRYHQNYLYAMQRQGKRVKEVYITPESRIEQLTPEQVINKIKK